MKHVRFCETPGLYQTTGPDLSGAPKAVPQSFIGPAACLLHLWQPAHGLVSHTSYIGAYPGPYPFF